MSEIQQLLGQMPVQQIAQQAGVSEQEARQAIEAIVPTLVGGMQANASDPAGAQSLMGALGSHAGHVDERLAGNVDTADGEKIVRNVFGDRTEQVARAAGGGALSGIIQKILPIVAPMVLAWIADKVLGGGQAPVEPEQPARQPQGDGSPFERGSAGADQRIQVPQSQPPAQRPSEGGGGLGDLLGGILGGGSPGQQGGSLGDVLGDLLGGGRR